LVSESLAKQITKPSSYSERTHGELHQLGFGELFAQYALQDSLMDSRCAAGIKELNCWDICNEQL
jgi:hypothetical protein